MLQPATSPPRGSSRCLAAPYFCAVPPDTPITPEGVDTLPSAGPYYVASHVPGRSLVLRRNPNYSGPRPQPAGGDPHHDRRRPERAVAAVEAGTRRLRVLHPPGEPEGVAATHGRLMAALRTRQRGRPRRPPAAVHPARAQRLLLRLQHPPRPVRRRAPAQGGQLRDRPARAGEAHGPRRAGTADRPAHPARDPGVRGRRDLSAGRAGPGRRATARRERAPPRRPLHVRLPRLRPPRPDTAVEPRARSGSTSRCGSFPLPQLFERLQKPGEPFDIAYTNWFFDYADPSSYINVQFGADGFYGQFRDAELAAADGGRGSPLRRGATRAYARLDRELAAEAAPAAPFATGTATHFLSARMGCQVLHPIFGLDLAALCVRRPSAAG